MDFNMVHSLTMLDHLDCRSHGSFLSSYNHNLDICILTIVMSHNHFQLLWQLFTKPTSSPFLSMFVETCISESSSTPIRAFLTSFLGTFRNKRPVVERIFLTLDKLKTSLLSTRLFKKYDSP